MGQESSFSEAEIIAPIREVEGGAKVGGVARKVDVGLQTLARRCARFTGMTVPDVKEKRRLEEETARLKKLVAQIAMDIDSLKAALAKKGGDHLRATGGGRLLRVAAVTRSDMRASWSA
jgi:putative transposase